MLEDGIGIVSTGADESMKQLFIGRWWGDSPT